MKKTLLIFILFFISLPAWSATTYYVRPDGGTTFQCTGTTDAAYPGSGTGQACALNHPAWAIAAVGTNTLMVGGDTLIIDDNGGTYQYMIGFGMPNTAGCSNTSPQNCYLKPIPSGIDAAHPTKIYGANWNTGCATKPQLWGTQSVERVLNINGSNNIDVECIEITDHSNCGFRVGNPVCTEIYPTSSTYGRDGVRGAFISNLIMKNVDIHGMGKEGMLVGDLSGVATLDHVNILGNYFAGWDGDDRQIGGTGSINNGVINILNSKIRFSGCREKYPSSASFTANDDDMCNDQNSNPPGYGDGLGSFNTGGSWNIINSEFSHNVQDGLDLRYCYSCQNVNIDKSLFEANTGNQLKISSNNLSLTNSTVIGTCNWFTKNGKVFNTSTWNDCRSGDHFPFYFGVGRGALKVYNTTFESGVDDGQNAGIMEVENLAGLCNGTETYNFSNVIGYNYNTNAGNAYYNINLTGSCATAFNNAVTDHSDIYHYSSPPSGTGVVTTNPLFTNAISLNSYSNIANITLTSSSPGKGNGSSNAFWNNSNDYNNFSQNSPIDMGAIQFGSSIQLAQSGQACIATPDCAAGTCSSFACTGSCTANGGACSSGSTCCSGTCTASACANPASCGDGAVTPPEVCDGANLNGSNCTLQGFTGGSLACASNCLSYNTSGCNNTTVFPLTPLLDNFNRASLGTNWTIVTGGFSIASNQCSATANSSSMFWNLGNFGPDAEVYVKIVTKEPTNGNSTILKLRYDSAQNNGYYLTANTAAGTDTIQLKRKTGGVTTVLATFNQEITNGDSIGMSVVGAILIAYYKSGAGAWTSLGTYDTTSDSTRYTTVGQLVLASDTSSAVYDDLGGGTLNPITCGNGQKDGTEICDGTDLGGQTCLTRGFASGILACTSDCTAFDTSGCVTASVCGNNVKEVGEICDGSDLASQTCAGLYFNNGTLTCASNCLSFVTTGCVASNSGVNGGVNLK